MKKILIVEDEILIGMNIQNILKDFGYDAPKIAFSGEEAIKIVEDMHPDLILMDIILAGEMDGIEAAAIIKDKYKIPVIYITGNADLQTIERARATEPYGYVLKPVWDLNLFSTIDTAFERYALEKKVQESEEKFRRVIECSPYAITVSDLDGNIIECNQKTLNLHGFSAKEEIIGINAFDLIAPGERENALANMKKTANDKFAKDIEYTFLKKNGEEFKGELSASILEDLDGKLKGFVVITKDITERKHAEEEIKRLNQYIITLQEEERQKVAKDLHDGVGQTILAAKLNIETYGKNPEKYNDRLEMGLRFIDKASQELREIYMDLYPSILNDIGLEAAIRWYAKNSLESNEIITEHNLQLHRNLSHDLEVNIYRIIQEIFSNILKYSKADRVYVKMYQDGNDIIITVEDNGVGFILEDVNKNKTGYGLSNIRQRIESYNGICSIDTVPNRGTKIFIQVSDKDE